jgi:hypothetical protein
VRHPDLDVRLKAVLEDLVELGDPLRDRVVDVGLLVKVARFLKIVRCRT